MTAMELQTEIDYRVIYHAWDFYTSTIIDAYRGATQTFGPPEFLNIFTMVLEESAMAYFLMFRDTHFEEFTEEEKEQMEVHLSAGVENSTTYVISKMTEEYSAMLARDTHLFLVSQGFHFVERDNIDRYQYDTTYRIYNSPCKEIF